MQKRYQTIGIILGIVTGLIGSAYYYWLKRPQQPKNGRVSLVGITEPVEIIWDKWGIPHIYAQNENDLFFAQGYIHAQDRLWQMEFNRRMVAGRLAEVLGKNAVPLDRWMRILCLRNTAEKEVELLEKQTRSIFESYTGGINCRIQQGRFPLEFNLLRYRPEPWSIVDSLSWGKMMAWNLSVNWEAELLRVQLINKLGPDLAALLEPEDQDQVRTIIPDGIDFSHIAGALLKEANQVRKISGPGPEEGAGSNNWVLSGSRTKTGKPLLANDMHLGMNIPSIWYENHLVGGSLNLSGITFPGFPGIVAGHNGHVAWGFTNGFPDVQDLYIEHIRTDEKGKIQYEYLQEWFDAEVHTELIRVRNVPTIEEKVIKTRHGPIINALAPDLCGETPLALRWTAHEPGELANAFFRMMHSRTCLEFREALRKFDVPTQNTVYADIDGNIFYSFSGKIPIRSKGYGKVPVPGWSGDYEWIGFIPFEELPHLSNPPTGYIATANNRVAGNSYSHWLGKDYIASNRAERICELIEANPKIDSAYIAQMQQDQVSIAARKIVATLANISVDDPRLGHILERLKNWDGNISPDLPEAAVYEVMVPILLRNLLNPWLGDLTERYIGKGPTPVLGEISIFGERAREWLQKVLSESESVWLSGKQTATKEQILIESLCESIDYLQNQFGPNFENWQWGKIHQLSFNHILGSIKPLNKLLNRGPYPIGGDFDTVWATGSRYHDVEGTHITSAPFRFIADLSNLDNSLGCLAPGQSGLPSSQHYDDQIRDWLKGKYHPMLYLRESVDKHRKSVVWLHPA